MIKTLDTEETEKLFEYLKTINATVTFKVDIDYNEEKSIANIIAHIPHKYVKGLFKIFKNLNKLENVEVTENYYMMNLGRLTNNNYMFTKLMNEFIASEYSKAIDNKKKDIRRRSLLSKENKKKSIWN